MAHSECGKAMPRGFIPEGEGAPQASWLWVCTLKPYHISACGGTVRRARHRELFSVFNDELWSIGVPRF